MESNENKSGLIEKFLNNKVFRTAVFIGAVSGIGLGIRDVVAMNNNERLTCKVIADGEEPNREKFDFVFAPYVPAGPLVPRSNFMPLIPEEFISLRDGRAHVAAVVNHCRDRFDISVTPAQVRAGVDKVLKSE